MRQITATPELPKQPAPVFFPSPPPAAATPQPFPAAGSRRRLAILAGSIAGLLAGHSAQAATRTWNNAAGGDFNTTGNWAGGIPVTADTGLFNSALTGNVTLSANAIPGSINFDLAADNSTTHDLTIGANGGNTLTFGNGGNLSVSGTLTGTGKTFTIAAPVILTPASATTAGFFSIQNDAASSTNILVVSGGISSATTSSTETLTLAGANAGTNTISGNITNGSATTFAVAKNGAGAWTLAGANTYNGATTIGAGTLNLTGSLGATAIATNGTGVFSESATGTIGASASFSQGSSGTSILAGTNSYTGATSISGGTLDIGGGTATGSINSAGALVLSGGKLNYTTTGGGTQAFASTSLNAGGASVNAAAGNTVNLGAITRAAGGIINFGVTGTMLTSTANTASGILGGYATFGGTNFAVTNGAGPITGLSTYDQVLDTPGDTNPAHNDNITTVSAQTQTAASNINTLTISSGSGTLALGTNPLTFTAGGGGGLLYSGGGNYTISGSGAGVVGAGSTGEAIFNVSSGGNLTISAQVGTNTPAAASLTTGGTGTVTLTGNNVYTGSTSVGPGTLQIGTGGATTLGGGNYAGAMANSGTLIFNSTSGQTFSGVISGSGSLTRKATGTLTLSNTNTYTGITTITGGGAISITSDANLGAAPASAVANQLTLDSGTLLITTQNLVTVANRGVTLGSGGGTVNQNTGGAVGIGGIITGPGSLTVTNIGGARTLNLNGSNTFTGGVIVSGGAQVTLNNAAGLGSGTLTLGQTANGSLAQVSGNSVSFSNPIKVTAGGNRSIQVVGGTFTASGPITLVGGATNPALLLTINNNNETLNITGGVTGSGNVALGTGSVGTRTGAQINVSTTAINNIGTITNAGGVTSGTYTISAAIGSNVTALIQNASAIPLVLSGDNSGASFFGDTTLTSGTINLQNGSALANSVVKTNATAGALTFGAGGTNVTTAQIGGFSGAGSATPGSFGDIVLTNFGSAGGALALTIGNSNGANGSVANANTLNPVYSGIISGAGSITKTGPNTQTFSGANIYAGGTTINGGTLLLSGANNLPAAGTLLVNGGANFSLADGTARTTMTAKLQLATGANLAFDWNGAAVDTLSSTAAAVTAGNVGIILNNTSPAGSGGTLISSSAGGLLGAGSTSYFLANNTNYTAALSQSDTAVSIGAQSPVAALTTAYWQGNKVLGTATPGVDNAWALSGAASNWSTTLNSYTATSVVPGGPAVNVVFSNGQGATQQSTVLGADMNLGSVTFDDATAVTIAGSNVLTLNSTSGAIGTPAAPGSAITVTSNAANPTISARVVLGANQTWNVAGGKTLTVSGIVSGSGTLARADLGTLALSGANAYTGGTNVQNGTVQVNPGGTLGATTGALTMGTGSAGTVGTVGNLTLNSDTAVGSFSVQSNTSDTTTPANIGQLSILTGKTLTIGGAMAVGVDPATAASVTTNTALGTGAAETGGALTINGNLNVGVAPVSGNTPVGEMVVVDLSGLSTFSQTAPGGTLFVGPGAPAAGKLTLATDNIINVGTLSVADSMLGGGGLAGNNYGGFSTLNLGTGISVLQASTITVGNGKGAGAIQFAAGNTTGSVTIAGLNGGANTAAITIGKSTIFTANHTVSGLLLAGHTATVNASTVIVGQQAGNTGSFPSASVTFDTGTFNATTIQLAVSTSGTSSGSPTGLFTAGGAAANSGATGVVNVTNDFQTGGEHQQHRRRHRHGHGHAGDQWRHG